MSTVLWANVLTDGLVRSDETDHLALYEHAGKLDTIARSLGLRPFLEICDTTDQRFNIDSVDLPAGMTSTNELMAVQGVWVPVAEALALLQALRDHVVARNVRFGLLSNQRTQVLTELDEVIAFAKAHSSRGEHFNFSVVI